MRKTNIDTIKLLEIILVIINRNKRKLRQYYKVFRFRNDIDNKKIHPIFTDKVDECIEIK